MRWGWAGMAGLLTLTGCATSSGGSWQALANCAAAYRVNAAIADPARAASMSEMISEVAVDYETAAGRRLTAAGKTEAEAQAAVRAQVATQTQALRPLPREAVEKLIEACPQPDV